MISCYVHCACWTILKARQLVVALTNGGLYLFFGVVSDDATVSIRSHESGLHVPGILVCPCSPPYYGLGKRYLIVAHADG
jgi:hypothetical protein